MGDAPALAFRALFGQPTLTLQHPSTTIRLRYSAGAQIASHPVRGLVCLIHGDVYGPWSDPRALLDEYARHGDAFARDLNGSCVILIADQRADRVFLVTDRINSRRMFVWQAGGACLFSSRLPLNCPDLEINPVGVGWYLSNGAVHHNRTILAGVNVLDRASIHDLHPDRKPEARRYWQLCFDATSNAARTPAALADELAEKLVHAVAIRLGDASDVFLSLSGGCDSRGIGAILARSHGVGAVRTFSYRRGQPQPGSDALLAQQTARSLGYPHEMVESYAGNLLAHIADNAQMGQAVAHPCDELDAWKSLSPRFAECARPALFVGDECFGVLTQTFIAPIRRADVFVSLPIRSAASLQRLRPYLPQGTLTRLQEGVAGDLDSLLGGCPATWHLDDQSDYLYVDQEVSNVLMPWRECYAGRCASVRAPYLDNAVLEFMATVPPRLRREKALYMLMLRRHYPQVLADGRCRGSDYAPDLASEFRRHQEAVRGAIRAQSSRLDGLMGPEVALGLLDEIVAQPAGRKDGAVRRLIAGAAPLAPRRIRPWVRRALWPLFAAQLDPAELLRRLLILRAALGKV
jgi:hypothetical protein